MTHPRTHLDDLQLLLDTQHGVVRTDQLRRYGYPKGRSEHLIDSGQWLSVLHGVVAVTNGPLTRDMKLSAALLYGGASAILSHDTAAEEWRMSRADASDPIHITVPFGSSGKSQRPTTRRTTPRPTSVEHLAVHPGVAVHRSRAIAHSRVDARFPLTSKADTALDLATSSDTPRDATIALVQAATTGRVPLLDIRQRVESRMPWRYRKPIADAIAMLADGVQSILEHLYALDVERAHGLPIGRRQGPLIVDGRVLYEDVDYTNSGVPLTIRLDGAKYHSAESVRFRDRRRDNAAELSDRPRLNYGWDEVAHNPCGVFHEVRTVLTREGWDDSSHPCPSCPLAQ